MRNKIIYVTKNEAFRIKKKALQNETVFFAEIYGTKIKTEEDYVQAMSNAFKFPHKLPEMKLGWYNDYINDLMWIDKKNIILLIHDYEQMLDNDMKTKENIIADFKEIILPWWEGEVVGHLVGGFPRDFYVYIEGVC